MLICLYFLLVKVFVLLSISFLQLHIHYVLKRKRNTITPITISQLFFPSIFFFTPFILLTFFKFVPTYPFIGVNGQRIKCTYLGLLFLNIEILHRFECYIIQNYFFLPGNAFCAFPLNTESKYWFNEEAISLLSCVKVPFSLDKWSHCKQKVTSDEIVYHCQ